MSDRRGSVFVEDRPSSAPAPQPIDAPVSTGEILKSRWTLSRQDFAGAELQAKTDAYGPIVTELMKRYPRDWLTTITQGDRYYNGARSGLPINTQGVWEDVARARREDPTFMRDIPAKDDAEFTAYVRQRETGRRRAAQDVVSRERGGKQGAIGVGSSIVYGLADPINLMSMAFTGGTSGAARSLAQTMAREALINAATEAAELPGIANSRAEFGETMTGGEMATQVAAAGAGGALFVAGSKLVAEPVASATAKKVVAPAARALRDFAGAASLNTAPLAKASDADLVNHFAGSVPAEVRTPDQRAAVHVLTRQADVDSANPFTPDLAGMEAHAARFDQATAAIVGAVKPAPIRGGQGLTQSGIIRFVLNDLEGGATVVPFSAADGGTTKFGIAAAHNPGVDVANLTEAQAAEIARRKYWFSELNTADPRAAAVAFDAGYISGPKVGQRILRESGGNPIRAIELYRQHLNHLADVVPGKAKFRKGWNNRVDKLAAKIGESESAPLRLDPERFSDDDASYRAAQDALNNEQLAVTPETSVASPLAFSRGRDVEAADLWQSHPDDLRRMLDEKSMSNDQKLVAALGAERAELFKQLDRKQNSMDTRRADEGAREFDEEFGNLTLEQERLVYGIGETEAQAEDIRQVLQAHDDLAAGESDKDWLGYVAGLGARKDDVATLADVPEGKASPATQSAYIRLQGGYRALLDAGVHPDQVPRQMVDSMVTRGIDPAHAEELIGGFVSAMRAHADRAAGAPREAGQLRLPASDRDLEAPTPSPPAALKFDTPVDRDAMSQTESMLHDVKLLAEAEPGVQFETEDGVQSLSAILADLDEEDRAINAVKGCL